MFSVDISIPHSDFQRIYRDGVLVYFILVCFVFLELFFEIINIDEMTDFRINFFLQRRFHIHKFVLELDKLLLYTITLLLITVSG